MTQRELDSDIPEEIEQEQGKEQGQELEQEQEQEQESAFEEIIQIGMEKSKGKKHMVFNIIGVCLGLLLIFLVCIFGYYRYVMSQVTIERREDVELLPEEFETDIDTDDDIDFVEYADLEDIIKTDLEDNNDVDKTNVTEKPEGVLNFLVCGIEAIGGGRGRTDCMVLVTINVKSNTIKLTSFMRDTYVEIPGYSNNKLNAAYSQGGAPLLADTLKLNFNVDIDGYVTVDFEKFEKLIDMMGGVDIQLTQGEASYLNRTNYISNPNNRNLKVGLNHMNGNQALGYSRVRYVRTANGLADDFGRNYRQRVVINSIFNKFKSKSVTDLMALVPKVASLITTNLSETAMLDYATTVVGMDLKNIELESFKVPIEGYYKGAKINKMSVIQITDLFTTKQKLFEYLYGNK